MTTKRTPLIKTIHPKTGAAQFWEVLPTNQLRHYTGHILEINGNSPNLKRVRETLQKVEDMRVQDLTFRPLCITEEECAEIAAGLHGLRWSDMRGALKGAAGRLPDGSDTPADPNPFVVRGKALPAVVGSIWTVWDNSSGETQSNGLTTHFSGYGYHNSITEGQQEMLRQWFGQQLIEATASPDVLAAIKADERDEIISYLKAEVPNYRRQLDEIAAFNG